jgi:hypothetical protein
MPTTEPPNQLKSTKPVGVIDKASRRDLFLSAFVPAYGSFVGLKALSNEQSRRAVTMMLLSAINLFIIIWAIDLLQ